VYTENWDGKFKKLSYELVSYASSVAEILNMKVTALSIGKADEGELKKLGIYGAAKIINAVSQRLTSLDNQAYTKVIADIALKEGSGLLSFLII
jgi:electron transfer flavoprotein alpha subunit